MSGRTSMQMVGEFQRCCGDQPRRLRDRGQIPVREGLVLRDVGASMRLLAERLHEAAGQYGSVELLRLQLCQEELAELAEAVLEGDDVGALDALCDMRYVADGTTHQLGFAHCFDEAFEEVHASNMSKMIDGRPVRDAAGRVTKPEGYFRPDLEGVLARADGESF